MGLGIRCRSPFALGLCFGFMFRFKGVMVLGWLKNGLEFRVRFGLRLELWLEDWHISYVWVRD